MAGLVSIPHEYYEAAAIDGACGWQRFRSITLLLVSPATTTVIILGLIGGLRWSGQRLRSYCRAARRVVYAVNGRELVVVPAGLDSAAAFRASRHCLSTSIAWGEDDFSY